MSFFPTSNYYVSGFQHSRSSINDEGYEGELYKVLNLRQHYAPRKHKQNIKLEAGQDEFNENNHTWNDACLFNFTAYLDEEKAKKLQLDDNDSGATLSNPNGGKLIPVTLRGIHALKKQFDYQNKRTDEMSHDINTNAGHDYDNECVNINNKFETVLKKCQDKHNEQYCRLIKLLKNVECMRNRNRDLDNAEYAHGNEYNILLSKVRREKERLTILENDYDKMHNDSVGQEEYHDIPDEDLEYIYNLLKEQHDGIRHLTGILNKDIRDFKIIQKYKYEQEALKK